MQFLSSISIQNEYKDREVTFAHFQILLQTISIAGQLLLTMGKRRDGRRIMIEFLIWLDDKDIIDMDQERLIIGWTRWHDFLNLNDVLSLPEFGSLQAIFGYKNHLIVMEFQGLLTSHAVESPFCRGRFSNDFCSVEKANKGHSRISGRKFTKISDYVFLVLVIFLQDREILAYFCL